MDPAFIASFNNSNLAEELNSFNGLYEAKLWHQLTIKLEAFFAKSEFAEYFFPVYQVFIEKFYRQINPVSFAQFSIAVCRKSSAEQALTLLNQVCEQIKEHIPAFCLCKLEACHFHLLAGNLQTVREDLESIEKELNQLPSIDPLVHSAFYRVKADYDKITGAYNSYYKNALLYLACIDHTSVPKEELTQRAHDLALSALIGDKIFNFGELLTHPIFNCLDNTKFDWLKEILHVFNSGDLATFESRAGFYFGHPLLAKSATSLQQKLRLMALLVTISKRSGNDRLFEFSAISSHTQVPVNEVEYLLMKAMSQKLIRGSIDQVNGVVRIDWAMPRILDRVQIGHLIKGIDEWQSRAEETAQLISSHAPEFVQ